MNKGAKEAPFLEQITEDNNKPMMKLLSDNKLAILGK